MEEEKPILWLLHATRGSARQGQKRQRLSDGPWRHYVPETGKPPRGRGNFGVEHVDRREERERRAWWPVLTKLVSFNLPFGTKYCLTVYLSNIEHIYLDAVCLIRESMLRILYESYLALLITVRDGWNLQHQLHTDNKPIQSKAGAG